MKRQEKRNIPRLNVRFNVYDSENNFLGVTKNISAKGCFLETKKNIKIGTMKISVEMLGTLGRIKINCNVTRHDNNGVGIKLIMDDEHIKNFARILENLPY